MVGGRTVNALARNRYAETSQHIQDLVYAHYNRDPERARFFATNNLAVPRDAFLELGGFDVATFPFASEDRSLWLRTARLRPPRRAAAMVPLLALWQAANAAGYLIERAGDRSFAGSPHPAATR